MKFIKRDLNDRTKGLGGSDIGALFGVSPWRSLPHLWLEKTGRLFKQQSDPDNEPQEWGREFETVIAKRYGTRMHRKVQRINRTIVHPSHAFMLANPDRFQFKGRSRGVLEIKATIFGHLREWSRGGIPADYYLQLQHYLAVTGLEWGSFAVLFGGNKLVCFDVARDDALIAVMIEREREFWELVQTRQPPTITLSTEWNKQMAAFYPTVMKGEEKQLVTPEAIGRARRYLRLKDQIATRQDEMEAHEVFFKQAIDNAERLLVPGIARFTWSAYQRSQFDLQALRRECPEIATAYNQQFPTRRFSTKALGEVKGEEDEPEEATPIIFGARRIELD